MHLFEVSVDPSAGAGVAAPIGSVVTRDDSGTGEVYWKHGAADAAWTLIGAGAGGDVSAAANLGAAELVIGDDGVKGVKEGGWTINTATGDLAVGARGDVLDLSGGLDALILSEALNELQFVCGSSEVLELGSDVDLAFWPTATHGVKVTQAKTNAVVTPGVLLRVTGAAHGDATPILASSEATDVLVDLARTVRFATGAMATQRAFRITGPTYAFAAPSVIDDAVTLELNAPSAGANCTITNPWSLRAIGNCSLNGWVVDTTTGNMSVGSRGDKLVFDADGHEYFYSSANNTLDVFSGNTRNLVFTSSGNLCYKTLWLVDDIRLQFGSSGDVNLLWSRAQTNHSLVWGIGDTSKTLIFCDQADKGLDFGVADQANPTMWWQAADATDPTKHGWIARGDDDFVIGVGPGGNGDLFLNPDGLVKFGTYAAKGAEAFAGFITIKDAAGNSRKVMVCA